MYFRIHSYLDTFCVCSVQFEMEKFSSMLKFAVSYSRLRSLKTLQKRCISSSYKLQYKWEPDDLKLEPDVPEYETLNIKIQGYDFPVLESFSKYVYRVASNMDIDCSRYPVPAKKLDINSLQFQSKVVTDSFKLNYYERVVQLQNLPSTKLQILLEMICGNTPEGVNVTLKENTLEDEEMLYIPDHQKRKIEQMIEDLELRRAK
ncbi:39S ribosomal protein L48, mitochondrial-like isoform X2 [Mercenaria mercenaria]|uniref:39S ribosomal protein L48, mitochondrial-like isoform X2 n=1 Tax=Mercenaria mercenaria TaxID=6596 RepID=UPI00234FAF3D|nr:39S ribosomal protein L48, mitochondrial-like isoform X2 [Mercenaria mercenaria]